MSAQIEIQNGNEKTLFLSKTEKTILLEQGDDLIFIDKNTLQILAAEFLKQAD